jgi:hypothetical protein
MGQGNQWRAEIVPSVRVATPDLSNQDCSAGWLLHGLGDPDDVCPASSGLLWGKREGTSGHVGPQPTPHPRALFSLLSTIWALHDYESSQLGRRRRGKKEKRKKELSPSSLLCWENVE